MWVFGVWSFPQQKSSSLSFTLTFVSFTLEYWNWLLSLQWLTVLQLIHIELLNIDLSDWQLHAECLSRLSWDKYWSQWLTVIYQVLWVIHIELLNIDLSDWQLHAECCEWFTWNYWILISVIDSYTPSVMSDSHGIIEYWS